MSLVGSLEDLGLGDILQIISLSRKSGVLTLRSERGEGRIVFRDGLIRGAFRKGGPTNLRELVAAAKTLPEAELEGAAEQARGDGVSLSEVLVERGLISPDALETLRGDNVESTVMRMFRWASGEFSFEVRDAISDEEIFPNAGINPQYLALDASRLADEESSDVDEDPGCESLVFDGEDDLGADSDAEIPAQTFVEAVAGEATQTEDGDDDVSVVAEALVTAEEGTFLEDEGVILGEEALTGRDALVTVEEVVSTEEPIVSVESIAEPERAPEGEAAAEATAPVVTSGPSPSRLVPPVVAIDKDLATLEWVKRALAETFPRVHIFQRSELGISRIRQYLARAEVPLVLLSTDAPADPLSGAHNAAEIVQRLKAQAPRMPIVVVVEAGAETEHDAGKALRADGLAEKPTASHLADPRCAVLLTEFAAGLRETSVAATSERLAKARPNAGGTLSPDALARLKEVSARMRDSASRGEVLPQVIQFASEIFSRVAMFMIRDETAQGIAQIGLPKAGGPDGHGLREVALPRQEPAWFRRVFDSRGPVRAAPSDDGDHRLAVLLGNTIPEEAYLAPIETGERVVAILYADNLPSGRPIGDTSALEVVLHEAGLALDRAWLERALEEAGG